MPGLTPLPDALGLILARLPDPPALEQVPLLGGLHRVLGADVVAEVAVPAADNSAMDGYAVRAADIPGDLPIASRVTAGSDPGVLPPGAAARVFTGALLPAGADTVVMQEDALERDGVVSILGCATPGNHVRRRGADIAPGEIVARAGDRLTPATLGVMASLGLRTVSVYRPLRVIVLSTGDELVDPESAARSLEPWQIFNSNRIQLLAQLTALGYDAVSMPTLPDEPAAIGAALAEAAATADCVITTGGVSVGEADHVRDQILARGELTLWKLAIKPGKPLAFGHIAGTPVFGLPGNPVSAWATFLLVVKPWLAAAQGAASPAPRRVIAEAAFSVERPSPRAEYLRVALSGDGDALRAQLSGSQSSGVLSSVTRADGLAVIPIGTTLSMGDSVEVLLMESLLSPLTA